MKFDKSRVYTAVNADELKVGDRVIVSDSFGSLKEKVVKDVPTLTIEGINTEYALERFETISGHWQFAYLVERAPEKKWRAYKDCDEMVADFKRRYGNAINSDNPMWYPLVWVSLKEDKCRSLCVAFIEPRAIALGERDTYVGLDELFAKYSYLDGSPCGMLSD